MLHLPLSPLQIFQLFTLLHHLLFQLKFLQRRKLKPRGPGSLAQQVTIANDEYTIIIPERAALPAKGKRPAKLAIPERTAKFSGSSVAAAAGVAANLHCWPVAVMYALSGSDGFASCFCPCAADPAHATFGVGMHAHPPALTKTVAQNFC